MHPTPQLRYLNWDGRRMEPFEKDPNKLLLRLIEAILYV